MLYFLMIIHQFIILHFHHSKLIYNLLSQKLNFIFKIFLRILFQLFDVNNYHFMIIMKYFKLIFFLIY